MASNPPLVEEVTINHLEQIALAKALQSENINDFEKAVGILKSLAEREKTARDNREARSMNLSEWIKTFSLGVVPFLTLITLACTVWFQSQQIKQSDVANADLGWRDAAQKVLGRLTSPSTADATLAIQILRPYFTDPRHAADAMDLAMFLAERIPDERVADAFYASPEIVVSNDNVRVFLNRARDISAAIDIARDVDASGRPVRDNDRRKIAALNANLRLISHKIADGIRRKSVLVAHLDLRKAYLLDADLTDVDLSTAFVSDATIAYSNLSGIDLSKVSDVANFSTPGSNWWDAKAIGGGLYCNV